MARYLNTLTNEVEVACDGCKYLIKNADLNVLVTTDPDTGEVYMAHEGCVAAMQQYAREVAETV